MATPRARCFAALSMTRVQNQPVRSIYTRLPSCSSCASCQNWDCYIWRFDVLGGPHARSSLPSRWERGISVSAPQDAISPSAVLQERGLPPIGVTLRATPVQSTLFSRFEMCIRDRRISSGRCPCRKQARYRISFRRKRSFGLSLIHILQSATSAASHHR